MILTSLKTYLSRQYRLLGITSNDLFTDEERAQLNKIGDISRALDEEGLDRAERKRLTEQKKVESDNLKKLFASYPYDKPRVINPKAVCMRKNGEPAEYITLERLKDEKIIQEFECELSRKLDVETDGFCWQKLNLQWSDKHGELLHQAFVNGIEADIETPEGRRIVHFDYFTASAGAMRTDRAAFLERDTMWRVWPELYAGLYPKDIDAHGGINLNKISAYLGLVTGASERWKLKDGSYFDIDRCIVVKDIESHVTCTMDHIDTEYNIDRGLHTEKVNQCDGVGYILPCACEASDPPVDNFMCRSPFLKGLLSKFDYLAFARENDCPAVATDVWGQEHDLIAEDIQVVFTESQLKLWSYYDSWDDYKNRWHENNCYLCRTNYEEDNIPDSEWNYQMAQTLLDMTDEELDEITKKDYDEIDNIDSNVKTQLKAFGCYNGREKSALQKCLLAYPPLLRDGYCREQLKDIKKSKIFDGKAGRLHIRNKRLFAVPDPYAAFERIFLHVEEPEGLLKFGEICTNEPSYNRVDEVDLLRSPHQ